MRHHQDVHALYLTVGSKMNRPETVVKARGARAARRRRLARGGSVALPTAAGFGHNTLPTPETAAHAPDRLVDHTTCCPCVPTPPASLCHPPASHTAPARGQGPPRRRPAFDCCAARLPTLRPLSYTRWGHDPLVCYRNPLEKIGSRAQGKPKGMSRRKKTRARAAPPTREWPPPPRTPPAVRRAGVGLACNRADSSALRRRVCAYQKSHACTQAW